MLQLAIPIPSISGTQDIEIEMTINNQRQKMHFRVEVYPWSDCEPITDDRIDCIRDLVNKYGKDWMIYHIGIPTEKYLPLTFVKTEDWERQRKMILEVVKAN